jgi:hypothetical protein
MRFLNIRSALRAKRVGRRNEHRGSIASQPITEASALAVLDAQTIRSREGVMPSRVVGPERISLQRNSYRTNPCRSSWRSWRNRTAGEGVTKTINVLRNSAIHIEVLEFIVPFDELFTVL